MRNKILRAIVGAWCFRLPAATSRTPPLPNRLLAPLLPCRRRKSLDSDGQYRHRNRLAAGGKPSRGQWHGGQRLCHRARPSALAPCAAEWRRAGGRDQRAAASPRTARASRAGSCSWCMKRAGAGVPSANRITLLRDADGDGVAETRTRVSRRPQLAVRHGAGRRRPLCRQHRCDLRFPYQEGETADHRARRQGRRPARRPDQPPLDQESDRQPRRQQALCDGRLQQQRRRERHGGREQAAPRFSKSIAPAAHRASSPPACAIRTAWPGSRKPGVVGRRQRARRARQRPRARLYDLGEGRRLLWLALQLLRPACRRPRRAATAGSGREGDRAGLRAGRAHRFARADLLYRQPACRRNWPTAPSSASTARGTASRAAATR